MFYDRITWGLSYMHMAGLIDKPKRGTYIITEAGRELLKTPDKINGYIDEVLKSREPVNMKKQTELKKLNIDFWDSMLDDKY